MSNDAEQEELPVVYALIWKANDTGEEADEAFQERIPRIMDWLKSLKQNGHLIACGGGGISISSSSSSREASLQFKLCPLLNAYFDQ